MTDRGVRPARWSRVAALITVAVATVLSSVAGTVGAQVDPDRDPPAGPTTTAPRQPQLPGQPGEPVPPPPPTGGNLAPTPTQPESPGPRPADEDGAEHEHDDDSSGGSGNGLWVYALVSFAAVAGGGVGALWARRGSAASPAPSAGAEPHPPLAAPVVAGAPDTAVDAARARAEQHRDLLVRAVIGAADQVTSDAIRVQLTESLQHIGIASITVEAGAAFDPEQHRGVHALPAASPDADGTVASCDRPGWVDGDMVLRLPDVVVYRWDAPA